MEYEELEKMEDHDFQEFAAMVLAEISKRGYMISKGIFELMDDADIADVQDYVGQYNSFDRGN